MQWQAAGALHECACAHVRVQIRLQTSSNAQQTGSLIVAVGDAGDAGIRVRLRDVVLQPLHDLLHLWQGLPIQLRCILSAPSPHLGQQV